LHVIRGDRLGYVSQPSLDFDHLSTDISSWTSSFCSGFVVAIETILSRYKPMSGLLKPDHVHDHGKLILTFVMLWAYFSFSQWLIIWAGNLPEEISWFVRRLNGGWGFVGLS